MWYRFVSVPYWSGQWLQPYYPPPKKQNAPRFSPLLVGSVVATLPVSVHIAKYSAFQSPIGRVSGCNQEEER